MQGFHFTPNAIVKIPKFSLERADKTPLKQEDVIISQIYGKLYCLHVNPPKKEIILYQLTREVVIKRQTLSIPISGSMSIQIIDNLLIVHNLDNKVVMIYDIKEPDLNFPVAAPLPLGVQANTNLPNSNALNLYNSSWIFYQPNLILDNEQGYLWEVALNPESLAASFPDKKKLVDFLMKRSNSKGILLQVLKNVIEDCETLSVISEIFDVLNQTLSTSKESVDSNIRVHRRVNSGGGSQHSSLIMSPNAPLSQINLTAVSKPVKSHRRSLSADDWNNLRPPTESEKNDSPTEERPKSNISDSSTKTSEGQVVIHQEDIYTHVFAPIEEEKGLDYKFMVAVLTEYIRSLNFNHIKVEPFLHELLINFLVRNNRFYQLHQLLQYHVVSDSVHVACQLLSLESTYPPAYQLALDMLKRLHTHEEILEVLLTKQHVTAALRFIKSHRNVKGVSAKRFLETTMNLGDTTLFYTVYKFFEHKRDLNECGKYVEHFKATFAERPTVANKIT